MPLLSLTVKLSTPLARRALLVSLHIYQQLYKKPPETGSFFRQLSRAAGNPRLGSGRGS